MAEQLPERIVSMIYAGLLNCLGAVELDNLCPSSVKFASWNVTGTTVHAFWTPDPTVLFGVIADHVSSWTNCMVEEILPRSVEQTCCTTSALE